MSYKDKELVFAGAGGFGMGTPWGTIGAIIKQALEPLGYKLHIEWRSHGANNSRYVGDGKADFGATHITHALSAFRGQDAYADESPRDHLRVIASINHASWYGIAVKEQSGIMDLSEIREKELAVRIKTGAGRVFDLIFEHYGLSRDLIKSYGGTFLETDFTAPRVPWVESGEFDLFVDTVYAAYTPEARHWWEASVLHDLKFLPLPDELVQHVCALGLAEPGTIPVKLMRGLNEAVPALARLPQIVYTRDDMPEDFAFLLARTLDESRHLFRMTHIPFSYDPQNAAKDWGIPLHPGAVRYYREQGYLG